jgi:hypothetical protein
LASILPKPDHLIFPDW